MAAGDNKPVIVIKKVTVAGGGHHGGAWKVAFADFMTAMMAFFLVMWLLGQDEATKEEVAEHFSTPSIIEYNVKNFGVELTLEKLFLDFLNDPLRAVQDIFAPMTANPNVLDFGSRRVVMAYMADVLGDYAKNVDITADSIEFDIPDYYFFQSGSAEPSAEFVDSMEKVGAFVMGLDHANLHVYSLLFHQSVAGGSPELAEEVAKERLPYLLNRLDASLANATVEVFGRHATMASKTAQEGEVPHGFIRLRVEHKKDENGISQGREMEVLFGTPEDSMSVYDNFVNQLKKRHVEGPPSEEKTKTE